MENLMSLKAVDNTSYRLVGSNNRSKAFCGTSTIVQSVVLLVVSVVC